MKRFLWPLLLFVALFGVLAAGLQRDPQAALPSPLLNRSAPAFTLPRLDRPERTLSAQDLRGRVWLLNVWASWCSACQAEHAALLELARSGAVPIYGLNYKDRRDDALAWLARLGDPYTASLSDTKGLVGIDYGVYGVPETFVVDAQGVIRLRVTGPLTAQVVREQIVPLLGRPDA